MKRLRSDLSVYKKLGFQRPPIAVKFLFSRPKGIKQLSMQKELSFCEMLKEAQETGRPFYFGKDNKETCVGKILLGMEEMKPFAESGQIGEELGIFQERR